MIEYRKFEILRKSGNLKKNKKYIGNSYFEGVFILKNPKYKSSLATLKHNTKNYY